MNREGRRKDKAMSEAELQKWLHTQLFHHVPCNIAVIDRDYRIVDHNRGFSDVFGEGRGRPCYELYKHRSRQCESCMAKKTFEDGKVRVNDEVGIDRHGKTAHYVVHIAPIYDEEGNIPYLVEMSTDVTETKQLQREYQVLFERVPCYVAVLDRNLRIVRANERFRETFGESTGKHCYEVYKHRMEKCKACPAELTFKDGIAHSGAHKGISKDGNPTHYFVHTTPLSKGDAGTAHVMEMALDMTEVRNLEEQLAHANFMREQLIENSIDGVIATDETGRVIIFNAAAQALLKHGRSDLIGKELPAGLLPAEFKRCTEAGDSVCVLEETTVEAADGEVIPVRFSGVTLRKEGETVGRALFLQDLREIKRLEQEKLDAERLAAVGQTVAGMAHGIKNILTGLEGGMYVVNTGLKKGRQDRIEKGWEMLERNIDRISTLARSLLSFSKGSTPHVTMVQPGRIVEDIAALYRDAAGRSGIRLSVDIEEGMAEAPFDPQGIHTCLANLVSNALDACQMSTGEGCRVSIRCREEKGSIIYEVEDEGTGMEYEIKQKVFTSFFTTKGSGGTGLGLLLTRKIVQEHGGRITVESVPGEGSLFRLEFPRHRLPRLESGQAGKETIV